MDEPFCLGSIPPPVLFLGGAAGGAGVGGLACKLFRRPPLPAGGTADEPEGIQAYATGTFQTPSGSGTVAVDGLGFEPDLLLFTITNAVGSAGTKASRTAGWSHGAAVRTGEGFAQQVVSVADDARETDAGVSATHWDKSIDVLVHGDDAVGSLAGSVTATTPDGFEVTFNGETLPYEDCGSYAVHYRAFATASTSDVQVGHFPVPDEPGTQTVPLGTDADFVGLAASSVPAGVDTAATTDDAVGLSRGQAVTYPREPADQPRRHAHSRATRARSSFDVIDQQTVCANVSTGGQSAASSADQRGVYEDRTIHLPGTLGDDAEEVTSARVTDLGHELELTFDEVATPEDPDYPQVVTFVAINTGEDRRPAIGTTRAPAPGRATEVGVGFSPGLLDVTGLRVDRIGRDEPVAEGVPFEYSCGVAMPGQAGTVLQQVLHPSIAADDRPAPRPSLRSIDPFRVGTTTGQGAEGNSASGAGADDTPAPDGGRQQLGLDQLPTDVRGLNNRMLLRQTAEVGDGHPPQHSAPGAYDALTAADGSPPAVAMALARDADGGVTGRDEIAVADFGDSGFKLVTDGAESANRAAGTEPRPVLLYTAWPPAHEMTPPDPRTNSPPTAETDAEFPDQSNRDSRPPRTTR
jgi:hypothetical protein